MVNNTNTIMPNKKTDVKAKTEFVKRFDAAVVSSPA